MKWIKKNRISQVIDCKHAWFLKFHMLIINLKKKKTQIKIYSKHFIKEDFILPDMLSIIIIIIFTLYLYSN